MFHAFSSTVKDIDELFRRLKSVKFQSEIKYDATGGVQFKKDNTPTDLSDYRLVMDKIASRIPYV